MFDEMMFLCDGCYTECGEQDTVCDTCGADLTNDPDESYGDHDDYDGQPTELQEWQDFDPDC